MERRRRQSTGPERVVALTPASPSVTSLASWPSLNLYHKSPLKSSRVLWYLWLNVP